MQVERKSGRKRKGFNRHSAKQSNNGYILEKSERQRKHIVAKQSS